ncbi:hypothetical protein JTE90_027983 [Oedothorax gibbosus]|uniref:Uncharacterized protein n=1 Tax=Oedothorax gibbosus TaxID=931172 RepID=A0AAV6VH18_9ARAC|nr:hypothetical protein JTE90_027983 [Oedothorax gibbosus]
MTEIASTIYQQKVNNPNPQFSAGTILHYSSKHLWLVTENRKAPEQTGSFRDWLSSFSSLSVGLEGMLRHHGNQKRKSKRGRKGVGPVDERWGLDGKKVLIGSRGVSLVGSYRVCFEVHDG